MTTTILGLNFEAISRIVQLFQTIYWFKLFRGLRRSENIHELKWKKGFSQYKILVDAPETLISECV